MPIQTSDVQRRWLTSLTFNVLRRCYWSQFSDDEYCLERDVTWRDVLNLNQKYLCSNSVFLIYTFKVLNCKQESNQRMKTNIYKLVSLSLYFMTFLELNVYCGCSSNGYWLIYVLVIPNTWTWTWSVMIPT